MIIEWEEIYSNSEIGSALFYEATYRASVIGGWLIRHETCCDYQYACTTSCENNPSHRHIDEEGYQNVRNTITFIPDPTGRWGVNIMDGVI
jgi:hypothetical protein